MTGRPFIDKQIPSLEKLVDGSMDVALLQQILEELQIRRYRKRNLVLQKKIQQKIDLIKSSSNTDSYKRKPMSNSDTTSANTSVQAPKQTSPVKSFPESFLKENFEEMRRKLLDITGGRSRLLNLKQETKGFVRIVDELPNQLADELIKGRSFILDSVPEPRERELIDHGYLKWDEEEKRLETLKTMPSAREWAKVLGIDIHYDLPVGSGHSTDGRHSDNLIQTVLFESALSNNMKKLAQQAKTSIEETGNNILFLSLGFLEWTDKPGGATRLAPLFMLPVRVEKELQNKVTRYSITFTGEDVITNLTLAEKLNQDFGVELPDVQDAQDEERLLTPEEYFAEVEALLERKSGDSAMSGWRVRRYGTLATLSLGRLLMYRDLDPARWPAGEANLVNHEFIRKFFSDEVQETVTSERDNSYVLDDVNDIHTDFPMIEDADSSQMSALIDIVNGKSMVVEGPPGTGKSQTITNLIAAAISQGKTVLFVAEKQAALDVVKRRMDKAGLGDFCLDLHSDKAQKRLVLDSFRDRILFEDNHRFQEQEFHRQVERYERSRKQLQDYCHMVNKPWKNTGKTIQEILSAATRYAKEVEPLTFEDVRPDHFNDDEFTQSQFDETLEQFELFCEYVRLVNQQLPEPGNLTSHPWYGVGAKQIHAQAEKELLNAIERWNQLLEGLVENLKAFQNDYGIEGNGRFSIVELESYLEQISALPELKEDLCLAGFRSIKPANVSKFIDLRESYSKLADNFKSANQLFQREVIVEETARDSVNEALRKLCDVGVDQGKELSDIFKSIAQLEKVAETIGRIEGNRSLLISNLPLSCKGELDNIFSMNQVGLAELSGFIKLACTLPPELASYRDDVFDDESVSIVFSKFERELTELISKRSELEGIFKLNRLPEVEELESILEQCEKSSFFSFLKSDWRAAQAEFRIFSKDSKDSLKGKSDQLAELLDWVKATEELETSVEYSKSFGRFFAGIKSDSSMMSTLINWYRGVRSEYGVGFGSRTVMATALFNMSKDVLLGIQQLGDSGLRKDIDFISDCLASLNVLYPTNPYFSDKKYLVSKDTFSETKLDISYSLDKVQKRLINQNVSVSHLAESLSRLEKSLVHLKGINNAKASEKYFDSELDLRLSDTGEMPVSYDVLNNTLEYLEGVFECIQDEQLLNSLLEVSSLEKLRQLSTVKENIESEWGECCQVERQVYSILHTKRESWFAYGNQDLVSMFQRNQTAIDNPKWLDNWNKFLFARERMQSSGYSRINEYLAENQFSQEYSENVMKFSVYTALANLIYEAQPELQQRSGHEQTAVQEKFKEYDEGLKKLQRSRVADIALKRGIDPGTGGARVSSYTGNTLLTHEIGKKTRHAAIRTLVTKAGSAMQGYKPCFMMSPMAVAKYLPPGSIDFDLVVMDEASQVKPEFALSCFARGRQVVVVGDPKQLPPTSFFDRATSDEDQSEEDRTVINESESILEAISSHCTKRMLKWHYRSRHESLIEFSNRHFYDSELVVFPSPWADSPEYGIKFNYTS